jgi:hypothetical protein
MDQSNAIMKQLPVLLTELNNILGPLLTQDFFFSWNKSNSDFLLDNFQNRQENFYRLYISLSNNTALLKSNFTNLPGKLFLIDITNKILSKISLEHQTLDNIYHATNSNLTELLNLPKSSYFDLNFSTLSNIIENQFTKMEDNEFLVRNINRILEMLSDLDNNMTSQLFVFLPTLLSNNIFQEFTLDLKNILGNMENKLLLNSKRFQTQFQDTLIFNLNPIINSLPLIEQILKFSLFLENQLNEGDIKSLNQIPFLATEIPRWLTDLKDTIFEWISPVLTQESYLNNHNILMSFIQNNLLTNDTFQNTLSSFFVNHFGEVKSMMKNILLNISNNSVSIS